MLEFVMICFLYCVLFIVRCLVYQMDFEHSCKWKRYYDAAGSVLQIRSTAGAVPVKNAKGKRSTNKIFTRVPFTSPHCYH